MSETRIPISLLIMYFPRNREFSSALSKLWYFEGLNPPPIRHCENLPKIAKQKEEHIQLLAFPSQESGGKCIWNIRPEISNLSEDPTTTARECGDYCCDLYFA
jgi:hypothetical protein